jgi:transposase
MANLRFRCRRRSSKLSVVHKPRGQFNQRVQAVGPEHFGVVSIDCAKARSKFMLTDFFGAMLIPPTVVEHGQAAFRAAHDRIQEAIHRHRVVDQLVAIERTGEYHRPVQRFFRDAGYDTRLVHPYASKQYRQSADPGNKTDDTDLAAIFRAAVNGFGLIDPPWSADYLHLQFLGRQRRDLVHKTTTLRCQLREVLHAIMPGYAECFPKLWESTVVLPVARHFGSAELICQAGRDGLNRFLRQAKLRALPTTLPKIVAWAENAPPAHPAPSYHQQMLAAIEDDLLGKNQHICRLEQTIASLLARSPYILLLALPRINVVSAADLAGEMGPPELYANANAITGRAGLAPSRYQSDQVDRPHGRLRRTGHRKLRFALLQIADHLIAHNHHYSVLTLRYQQAGKDDPRWLRVKIAKGFSRLAFAMLTTGQIFRHPCCQPRHYLLDKLLAFHREHDTPWPQIHQDLDAATGRLPRSSYAAEGRNLAQRLEAVNRQRPRGPRPLCDAIALVLAKLGITQVPSEPTMPKGPS